jgi:regulator of nucleoside diphosphate kinase
MRENSKNRRKPNIVISQTDYRRLYRLAIAAGQRMPEASDELLSELDRARIVPDAALPADVVRMSSTVEFKPDTGAAKTVSLVFPEEADIAQGKVSILTPIGTALIGLKPGQSITWQARDGRQHELMILSVRRPILVDEHRESDSVVQAGA